MADPGRDGAGGIGGLVALLREHGEAIDADLQREYQLSLNDWAGGRVTTRRLLGLINRMTPEGTAWQRELIATADRTKRKPPPDWWWTPERDLLMTLIDLKRLEFWRTSDPKMRGPAPTPLDRPSVRQVDAPREPAIPNDVVLGLLGSVAPVPLVSLN